MLGVERERERGARERGPALILGEQQISSFIHLSTQL